MSPLARLSFLPFDFGPQLWTRILYFLLINFEKCTCKEQLCLAIKKDSITSKTVCMTCGGRGHVSRVDGMTCMTLTLGVEVPKDVVKQVTYPDGVTFPVFKPRPGPGRGGPSARPRSGYDSSGGKSRVREVMLDKKTQDDSDSDNEQEVQLAIDVGSVSI